MSKIKITGTNLGNKRLPVKWIRDANKRRYNRGDTCAICGTTENVQFHHYYSLTLLFEAWLRKKNIAIVTDEDVLAVREDFSNDHQRELFDEAVDLCKAHHDRLHSLYGITPLLITAEKQKRWVSIQAEKHGLKYEYTGKVASSDSGKA